jgi:hypothetical protein
MPPAVGFSNWLYAIFTANSVDRIRYAFGDRVMMRSLMSALVLSTCLVASQAIAADPPRLIGKKATAMTQKHFAKADKNDDRFITVEEWVGYGYKVAKFSVVDVDKNGKVSVKEFLMAQEFCATCF